MGTDASRTESSAAPDRGECHVVIYLADVTEEQIQSVIDAACETLAGMGLAVKDDEDDDTPVRSLVGLKALPFPDLEDESIKAFLDEHARFAIPCEDSNE